MTAAQWQKVKEVTADALERDPSERATFVHEACSDDPAVCQEALRLVGAAGEAAGDFLSTAPLPLGHFVDGPLTDPTFSPGQVVAGRFEIVRFISRGGMGEVYAAMDLELRETVALKTIRPGIAASDAVIQRFKEEVRQTRRVTHPNVCRVYDLFSHEQPGGKPVWFLTMELLEGQTLADRIRTGGPFSFERALPIIRGMVSALAAAHDIGIVHRDFKPSNVMLVGTPSGTERAVVTDFGLAVTTDATTSDRAGTPAYIAPEQNAGETVGPAADQFPLGLVIGEMLTGKRPSRDQTCGAISKGEIEIWFTKGSRSALNSKARRVIARCVEQRPEDRFRSVRDVLSAIDGSEKGPRRKFWVAAAAVAAIVVAASVIVAGADWSERLEGAVRITPETDWSNAPSISRDGKWVAYTSNRAESSNMDIWTDSAHGGAARRLTTNPAQDIDPAIAPDGKSVVFRSERNGGGLYVIGSDGSGERLLAPDGRSPAFSPDGRLIAYWTGDPNVSAPSGKLFVVPAEGGSPRPLVPDFTDASYPAWSPDSRFILFEGCSPRSGPFPACIDFWVVRADGTGAAQTGAMAQIHKKEITVYPHQKAWRGNQVYFSGRRGTLDGLWRLSISPRNMRAEDLPQQATPGDAREHEPSFAATGAMAFGRLSGALHTWRIPLDGSGQDARASRLTDASFGECCPAVSRDGDWLFFTRRIHTVKDLFRKNLKTGEETVLLSSAEEKLWPVPDAGGTRVAFGALSGDRSTIQLIEGNGPPRTVCTGCSHPTSWFGHDALLHTSAKGDIEALDIRGGGSRVVVGPAAGRTLDGADWSPVHEYLLFTAGANGIRQVYAVHLPLATGVPDGRRIVLTPDDHLAERPRWSPDGKTLYYLSDRDGYLCVWGQRFAAGATSAGTPFPVIHYHESIRFSPGQTDPPVLGFSVGPGFAYLNVGEAIETVWVGYLGRPSLGDIFRDALGGSRRQ